MIGNFYFHRSIEIELSPDDFTDEVLPVLFSTKFKIVAYYLSTLIYYAKN